MEPRQRADSIDRRSFLGVCGAAAILAASGQVPRPRRDRNIRKALKIGMVQGKLSLEERFRVVREVGFDGIELNSPSDLDHDEVLSAKAATGLEIPGVVDSVHWKQPLSDADPGVRARGRAALETALRDCKAFGGTSVLLVPAVVNKQTSYDQAYERSQAEIRRVVPLAQELGVRIAIENVWNGFLLSPLEAARYIDELDSPWVGWHLDVGNIVNFGFPEQWVRILGHRILKLDVKGFSRTKRDQEGLRKGFDVPIGEGDCDWPSVMSALDEIGYEGWASAEVRGGNRQRLAQIAQRMDVVLSR